MQLARSVFEERLPWPDNSLNTYYTSARKFEATGDLYQAEKLYSVILKKLDAFAATNKVSLGFAFVLSIIAMRPFSVIDVYEILVNHK